MERLDGPQLEGVIAHELSHIANRDVVVMTVAGFLATVAGLLVRIGVYSGMGGRGSKNGVAVFAVVIWCRWPSTCCRSCCCGRCRATASSPPTAAPRSSPGRPRSSPRRSPTISGTMERVPTRDLRAAEGMNAFFIIPAVSRGFSLSSLCPPTRRWRSASSG